MSDEQQPTDKLPEGQEQNVLEVPQAPVQPAQPAAEESAPAAPASEDRSEFNCPTCGGEGLVKDGPRDVQCSNCQGKGKV